MSPKSTPTFEELNNWARYDPETGVFFRQGDDYGRYRRGDPLRGTVTPRGYVMLSFRRGQPISAHRAAFCIMTGRWPEHALDHINGNRADNRWINLRLANHSQNRANSLYQAGPMKRGVSLSGSLEKPFKSRIQVGKERVHLGFFRTEDEAHLAYITASLKYFGEFSPFAR
jgi:hypothetical protein